MSHGSGAVYNWALAAQYITNNAFEIVPSTVVGGSVFTTPVATFKSDGNVGIGTTSPDAKFQVEGNVKVGSASGASWTDAKDDIGGLDVFVGSGSYAFQVWDDNDQTNPRFVVERAGNVGIGTTAPGVRLHIVSSTPDAAIFDTTSSSYGAMNTFKAQGVTKGASGYNAGAMYFGGEAGTNTIIQSGGQNGIFINNSTRNVGIGTTVPYSVLDVNGVITNRTATQDPNFTVTVVGMSSLDGGSLQFTQGFAGSSSAGDTVVFRYNAASWKSWSLDYTFASTNGLVKGTIGGYNNNSGGGTNFFLANQMVLNTPVATNSGQNVIVTFTGNFGIHMMCDMRYSQGGGDGSPRADRASLTYNS
jgi:hypothetical protein